MKNPRLVSVVVVLIVAPSCAGFRSRDAQREYEMNTLAGRLRDLTPVVESAVIEDPAGTAALSDEALVLRATKDRPALYRPFEGYKLRTTRAGESISLLVCTGDGTRALLEDASCTVKLDREPWRQPAVACQPTLQLATVCPVR